MQRAGCIGSKIRMRSCYYACCLYDFRIKCQSINFLYLNDDLKQYYREFLNVLFEKKLRLYEDIYENMKHVYNMYVCSIYNTYDINIFIKHKIIHKYQLKFFYYL